MLYKGRYKRILDKVTIHKKTGFDRHYANDELILMSRIAEGNMVAFQTVIDLHMIPVFHFAYSILRDATTAEDITQETCIKLLKFAKLQTQIQSLLFKVTYIIVSYTRGTYAPCTHISVVS